MFSRLKKAAASAAKNVSDIASAPKHAELGTRVQVGAYNVTVEKALAEGGFAVVFLAKDEANNKSYALKKIMAADHESIKLTTQEIKVMEKLSSSPYIVKMFASDKKQNGRFTEFWLLMELCPDGHIVDLMNTRLDRPFTEKEVLKIFEDCCEGMAVMHNQSPPIAHRDIKPENVLKMGDRYKLCDFGSSSVHHVIPGENGSNRDDVEDDIAKNTTLQYRAPEQVDLWKGKRIDEKVDIWALGVLLYKLMFFEDAFGESTLAILGGKYKIPPGHAYSDGLLSLVKAMLDCDPDTRYNIADTLRHIKQVQSGKPVAAAATQPAASGSDPFSAASATTTAPATGSDWAAFGSADAGTNASKLRPSRGSHSGWASFSGAAADTPAADADAGGAADPFGGAGGGSQAAASQPARVVSHGGWAFAADGTGGGPAPGSEAASPNPFGSSTASTPAQALPQEAKPNPFAASPSTTPQAGKPNPFASSPTTVAAPKEKPNPFAATPAAEAPKEKPNPFAASPLVQAPKEKPNPFAASPSMQAPKDTPNPFAASPTVGAPQDKPNPFTDALAQTSPAVPRQSSVGSTGSTGSGPSRNEKVNPFAPLISKPASSPAASSSDPALPFPSATMAAASSPLPVKKQANPFDKIKAASPPATAAAKRATNPFLSAGTTARVGRNPYLKQVSL